MSSSYGTYTNGSGNEKDKISKNQLAANDERARLLLQSAVVDPKEQLPGFGDTFPDEHSNCCSNVFFSWLTPVMDLGNQRPLEFDDLYQLNPENRADQVSLKFEKEWAKQCERGSYSIASALFSAFGFKFYLAGVLKLIHDSLLFVGPMVIKRVIAFLGDKQATMEEGLIYVAIMFASSIIQSFTLRQYFYYCYLTGMRFRSSIVTAVYKKSLVLSAEARQSKTTGEITNLMSVDAQRLQDLTPYLHGIWYGFFQIIVSCYLLWNEIGPACLGGIAVIIVSIPITGFISRLMRTLQEKLMKVKDSRVKICVEVLNGMKVIKYQAWENSFTERVMKYRNEELSQLRTYLFARAGSGTVFNSIASLVAVASFLMYVMLGNTLDVATALTSLALFNILRFPLFMLPQVINNVVEATVSFKRLSDFLKSDERVPVDAGSLKEVAIRASKAHFSWQKNSTETTDVSDSTSTFSGLKDVDLDIKNGELFGIVGHVGSGKSTLLSGLLGDAYCKSGQVNLRGRVAYVSQEPFIQNATVRENITFNLPFDAERYNKAIYVSALTHDLKILPAGDRTEIGEKGINLSGGQRTRVSIARAVYQDADVYLFDDPLAAVDGHVGMHIFEKCILQALSTKLRILVTNGVSCLPRCDRLAVLERGRVVQIGTYKELKDEGIMKQLLKSNAESEQKRKDDISEEPFDIPDASEVVEIDPPPSATLTAIKKTRTKSLNQEHTSGGDDSKGDLMTVEERSTGDVPLSVYLYWVKSAGGYTMFFFIILSFFFSQAVNVASTLWLSYWSEEEKDAGNGNNDQNSQHGKYFFLYVYISLNFTYTISVFIRLIVLLLGGLRASRQLFNWVLSTVIRAPMRFFDTTPLGRIVNRLSKDVYVIDEQIPSTWNMYLGCMVSVLSTLLTICFITPYFVVVLIPVAYGYYRCQRYFIKTSRELQRLDSISRSPVFALLTETIDGLSTIHAYHVEKPFTSRSFELLDRNQRAYFLNFSINCWLALRLEFSGTMIATGAVLFAVLGHNNMSPYFAGLAGVSLSYAFSVTQTLNWSVRMVSQLQTQMVAVERVKEYSEKEVEADLIVPSPYSPKEAWPEAGVVEFEDVVLRYRPGLPRVLRGLSFKVFSNEKVGIVGRTGAGKSSLMVSLMRIVELDSGRIKIDGLDISSIGLHQLRNRISIIPQDPVLFSGSVRQNLDPFFQYSDEEIWRSLRRARLGDVVGALDFEISERGLNYSVGERQLFCIARALLKKSKIILMDEATASIDIQTDQLIQQSIRDEFSNSTCLTIAHRVNTIMDSDRVLVMDNGRVAEFDTPTELLKNKNGIYSSLVQHWKDGVEDQM